MQSKYTRYCTQLSYQHGEINPRCVSMCVKIWEAVKIYVVRLHCMRSSRNIPTSNRVRTSGRAMKQGWNNNQYNLDLLVYSSRDADRPIRTKYPVDQGSMYNMPCTLYSMWCHHVPSTSRESTHAHRMALRESGHRPTVCLVTAGYRLIRTCSSAV